MWNASFLCGLFVLSLHLLYTVPSEATDATATATSTNATVQSDMSDESMCS